MGAGLNKTNLSTATLILVAVSICGIHFSNAIASMSLLAAIVTSIYPFKLNQQDFKSWAWLLAAFVLYQLTIEFSIHSQNSKAFIQNNLVKVPLLFSPLLFNIRAKVGLTEKIIMAVSLFISWTALASVFLYLNNKAFYDVMILESKPLPLFSKVYHIEYSLLLSLSCLSMLYFGLKNKDIFKGKAQLGLAAVLILCLHILSARTGLLALYFGIIPLFFMSIRQTSLKVKLRTFSATIVLGLLMYQVPSLKKRIKNSKEDLSTVLQGTSVNNKSFGQRWVAWNASVASIKKEPVFGYGKEHVKSTIDQNYLPHHESKIFARNKVMPHNVYLETMVQSGFLAGFLYLMFFAAGIIYSLRAKKTLLMALLVALMAASMFESITERQAGVIALIGFISLAGSLKTVEQKG